MLSVLTEKFSQSLKPKKISRSPDGVLTQAVRYAEGLKSNSFNFNGIHVPFLYSTNWGKILFHDVRNPLNLSHEIAKFHTPESTEKISVPLS